MDLHVCYWDDTVCEVRTSYCTSDFWEKYWQMICFLSMMHVQVSWIEAKSFKYPLMFPI